MQRVRRQLKCKICFSSAGDCDTITQGSRCKSSLSKAATFWARQLWISVCFCTAKARNLPCWVPCKFSLVLHYWTTQYHTMTLHFQKKILEHCAAQYIPEPSRSKRTSGASEPKSGCFAQRAFASAILSNCVTFTCREKQVLHFGCVPSLSCYSYCIILLM